MLFRSKSVMYSLFTAALAYNEQNGEFPADQSPCYPSDVAAAGETYIYQLTNYGAGAPYFDAPMKDRTPTGAVVNTTYLLDPWRTPYVYVVAPQRRAQAGNVFFTFPGKTGQCNLFSLGPNRTCQSCCGNAPGTGAINTMPTGSATTHVAGPATDITSQAHCGGGTVTSSAIDDVRNW